MTSTLICSAAWLSGWRVCCRNSHAPRVLELGCGTGLFSRHLLARYPDGRFLLTDLAPSMVEQCRRNLAVASKQRVSFEIMDAARPTADGPFDLIATSMTLHWLADPAAALATLRKRLAPGGVLIYATISGKSFPEWRATLEEQGLPIGPPRHPRASRRRR